MSRIILKVSGEALKSGNDNVSADKLKVVLETIKILQTNNHKIGIVIGGGNFFRGREHDDMNKVTGDTIGMLGTVMNALYLHDYLDKFNINSIISTPFDFPYLLENFTDIELKDKFNDNVVIFGGGVGMSGYSTDSGVILALKKLEGDLVIKLTNVDGVYTDDPKINPASTKIDELTFASVIENKYNVMDEYAFKECEKMNVNIIVMNFNDYKYINEIIARKSNLGTFIGV